MEILRIPEETSKWLTKESEVGVGILGGAKRELSISKSALNKWGTNQSDAEAMILKQKPYSLPIPHRSELKLL